MTISLWNVKSFNICVHVLCMCVCVCVRVCVCVCGADVTKKSIMETWINLWNQFMLVGRLQQSDDKQFDFKQTISREAN